MTFEMTTVAQCAAFCGLRPHEIVLGVSPAAMHESLYDSYMLRRHWGRAALRDAIVADLRMALDLGAKKRAGDLLIVLRRLLCEQRVAEDAAPTRPRWPSEGRRTRSLASAVERICATRREALRREATSCGNVLSLDAVRRLRQIARCGDR